jgi:hypothetical protein
MDLRRQRSRATCGCRSARRAARRIAYELVLPSTKARIGACTSSARWSTSVHWRERVAQSARRHGVAIAAAFGK